MSNTVESAEGLLTPRACTVPSNRPSTSSQHSSSRRDSDCQLQTSKRAQHEINKQTPDNTIALDLLSHFIISLSSRTSGGRESTLDSDALDVLFMLCRRLFVLWLRLRLTLVRLLGLEPGPSAEMDD